MKERPILFQGAMVRALLEGRKTQTRRIIKPQPLSKTVGWGCVAGQGFGFIFGDSGRVFNSPYGIPGDRLWVRETWKPDDTHELGTCVRFKSDDAHWKPKYWNADQGQWCEEQAMHASRWRPSIHMPRWASRITLEIVSVRVERLLQISEEDAIAEGAMRNDAPGEEWDGTYLTQRYIDGIEGAQNDEPYGSARDWYREVWEGINGPGSWKLNPWVWVVEFKGV